MKKCPSCDKTYEDSMRFCQIDGTPLVDVAPPIDPYKTIVGRPADIPASEPAEPVVETLTPVEPVAEPIATAEPVVESVTPPVAPVEEVGIPAINEPEEVLDLPQPDPLKTMYVSEAEMKAALSNVHDSDAPDMEIPEVASPEPPKFAEPEISSPPFASAETPASPFSESTPPAEEPAAVEASPEETFNATSPPIPSPFGAMPPVITPIAEPEPKPSMPEPPSFSESETVMQPFPPASPFSEPEPASMPTPEPVITPENELPPFKEPEPFQPAVVSPIESSAPAEWTPPPAPDAAWQNQEIGQNTPFQPPPAGGKVNQTLPIVCLVLGIVSICCYISPLTGLGALITGFLSMKNIKNDPANYGGKGLAVAGMIVGGIFFLIGLAYYIIIILMYAGIIAGSMLQGY